MSQFFAIQNSLFAPDSSNSSTLLEKSLERVLNDLLQGDFQQRWQAMKGVAEFGETVITPLLNLVQDDDMDWEVRWFAARALGQFPHPVVLQSLVDLLTQTQDRDLRTIATAALGQFGLDGIAALTQLMQDPQHRLLAVQTLAGMRQAEAMTPLLEAARADDPSVRQVAVVALGTFRAEAAGVAVLQALKDLAAGVRQEAATALGRPFDGLDRETVVNQLVPCLWDMALPVCQAAARTLGRLGTATAVDALIRVGQSPHTPEVLQISVVQALGWQPRAATLEALLSIKDQVPQPVQLEIVDILGRMQASEALRSQAGQALETWLSLHLHDPQAADLKRSLALALGHLNVNSARPLLQHLSADADERIALYADAALRQLTA
jgi:HEAT repeat protein